MILPNYFKNEIPAVKKDKACLDYPGSADHVGGNEVGLPPSAEELEFK